MKKFWVLLLGLACGAAALPVSAADGGAFHAQWTPFEWGVFPPVQLFDRYTNVDGFRLSTVYSKNAGVYGLDTGVVGGSDRAGGLQVNLLNMTSEKFVGMQVGLVSSNDGDTQGVQIAGANITGSEMMNTTGKTRAAQIAYVNISNNDFAGNQIGVANLSNWKFYGCQLGLINVNDDSNAPTKATCVQVGLINFNTSGFLICFPLVNF